MGVPPPELPAGCLIVGLGNPGKEYEMTRHNLGFMVVEAFASKHGLLFKKSVRLQGKLAEGVFEGKKLALLLPSTYMNLSGESVQRALHFFKIRPTSLLVVVDDVYVPFNAMRMRGEGGTGGHNGLKSIQACIHTQSYPRLRMGVGKRSEDTSESDLMVALEKYVLSRFTASESQELPDFLGRAVLVLEEWLKRGNHAASMLAGNLTK